MKLIYEYSTIQYLIITYLYDIKLFDININIQNVNISIEYFLLASKGQNKYKS